MMIRKILLTLAALLCGMTLWAQDEMPVQVNTLPHLALSNLKSYFPDVEVVKAYTTTAKVKNEYTTCLANGVKIVFDKHGQWSQVEANGVELPQRMIPGKILMFLSQNSLTSPVAFMAKDKKGNYYIVLADETELYFDNQFRPITKKK